MSHYVQICAGPYVALLDAEDVQEVLALSEESQSAAGHYDWRGQVLATVNMRALFGVAERGLPRERAGIVYSAGAGEAPVVLEFDRVMRLRNTEWASFLPLPPVPDGASRLFDGVLPDEETGLQLYHLKRPLAVSWQDDAFRVVPPVCQAESAVSPEVSGAVASFSSPKARKKKRRTGEG